MCKSPGPRKVQTAAATFLTSLKPIHTGECLGGGGRKIAQGTNLTACFCKILLEKATLIQLCIVCGCFEATKPSWVIETDHLVHQVYTIYYLTIYIKCLLVPGSLVAKIAENGNKLIRNKTILGTKVWIPGDRIGDIGPHGQASVWSFGTMSLCITPVSILALSPVSGQNHLLTRMNFPAKTGTLSTSANILLFQLSL